MKICRVEAFLVDFFLSKPGSSEVHTTGIQVGEKPSLKPSDFQQKKKMPKNVGRSTPSDACCSWSCAGLLNKDGWLASSGS